MTTKEIEPNFVTKFYMWLYQPSDKISLDRCKFWWGLIFSPFILFAVTAARVVLYLLSPIGKWRRHCREKRTEITTSGRSLVTGEPLVVITRPSLAERMLNWLNRNIVERCQRFNMNHPKVVERWWQGIVILWYISAIGLMIWGLTLAFINSPVVTGITLGAFALFFGIVCLLSWLGVFKKLGNGLHTISDAFWGFKSKTCVKYELK